MKKIIILIIATLLLSACTQSTSTLPPAELITNFEECIAAGNPAMESYPRQCRAGDNTFVEYIGNELEKQDLIRIDNPRPNQEIESSLLVQGQARGSWFFEAEFPVVLADQNGQIIAETYATAQGEWMIEEFVDFKATLEFEKPKLYNKGTLFLHKANPTGMSKHGDALEVPVYFKKPIKEQANTADWQVYSSERYGFEFQYPGSFNLDETIIENWLTVVLSGNNTYITISNKPIGFELAVPLDKVLIDGIEHDRSVNPNVSSIQHIIGLSNGFYINYVVANEDELETIDMILGLFRYLKNN